jgi:hypothetical protein
VTPVWAETRLLVWVEWSWVISSGSSVTGNSGVDLWSLDPSSGPWAKLGDRATSANAPGGVTAALWTGTEAILPATVVWNTSAGGGQYTPGHGPTGYRYNPSTNSYRSIAHSPVDDASRDAVWTGGALVRTAEATIGSPGTSLPPNGAPVEVVQPGEAAAWDPATNQWTVLPRAPIPGFERQLVWTGREIISYGQDIGYRFGP